MCAAGRCSAIDAKEAAKLAKRPGLAAAVRRAALVLCLGRDAESVARATVATLPAAGPPIVVVPHPGAVRELPGYTPAAVVTTAFLHIVDVLVPSGRARTCAAMDKLVAELHDAAWRHTCHLARVLTLAAPLGHGFDSMAYLQRSPGGMGRRARMRAWYDNRI